jgi:hypothetical protein
MTMSCSGSPGATARSRGQPAPWRRRLPPHADLPAHHAVRAVGADDHARLGGPAVRAVQHHPVGAHLDAAHRALREDRARGHGGVDQPGVEHRPGHHDVGTAKGRGHHRATRRHDAQPPHRHPVGQQVRHAEQRQLVERVRRDAVAAALVAREGRAVQQQHPRARPGRQRGQRGRRARRPRAHHRDVPHPPSVPAPSAGRRPGRPLLPSSVELVLVALGLGLAGIDPLGALVVLAALSRQATRRAVVSFSLVVLLGTTAFGAGLAVLVGDGVGGLADRLLDLPDVVGVVLESVLVVLLLRWAYLRWSRRNGPAKEKRPWLARWLDRGLPLVGGLFVVSAVTDPTFVALVALASREHGLAGALLASGLWTLVSQAPLFVLVAAVLLGAQARLLGRVEQLRRRWGRWLPHALTAGIALAGLLLLADLVVLAATGSGCTASAACCPRAGPASPGARMGAMLDPAARPRVLSGIRPTGQSFQLGNYVGAVRHWAGDAGRERLLLLPRRPARPHRDPEPAQLRERTRQSVAELLAMGVDPERSAVFAQSHLPQHAELGWVLGCLTGFGEASRMTQFKDKGGGSVGLFTYPVLQAADILMYQADAVPIGADQRQHLELTRDLAQRFNARYGDTFVLPAPYAGRPVSGSRTCRTRTAR